MTMNESNFPIESKKPQDDELTISRRRLLKLGTLAALTGILPQGIFAASAGLSHAERSLAFYNTHTAERLETLYWVQGSYLPESLGEISYILRDHRTDEIQDIDARLLDLLFALRKGLETQEPFHIISGYRSAQTNARLHAQSSGVAENSLHLLGQAIDVRIPGRALPVLRNVAMTLKGGGVGYYPKSDFVHIDVGRVRYW
jgi:uncharacterized protein YcbK (DUF882 family)